MAPIHIYPAIYAFDCDDTLAVEGAPYPGPVVLNDVLKLRNEGNITGICGNFQLLFKFLPMWYHYFSFYGPTKLMSPRPADHMYKHVQLIDIKEDIKAAKYVMVGNKRGDPKARSGSQDDVQAKLAGWTFISEKDFASGKR